MTTTNIQLRKLPAKKKTKIIRGEYVLGTKKRELTRNTLTIEEEEGNRIIMNIYEKAQSNNILEHIKYELSEESIKHLNELTKKALDNLDIKIGELEKEIENKKYKLDKKKRELNRLKWLKENK